MKTTTYPNQRRLWISLLILPLIFGLAQARANEVDNRIYADLLGRYVKAGVVDYKGLKTEEARLDAYLSVLAEVDPSQFSREARFAFYINAYNAWTLKLILGGYPGVASIKDMGSLFASPWKKKIARIDGEPLSLDEIEHEILRPEFKDARVHFAINCAALSCPPLKSEPYEAHRLENQLTEATIAFVNRTDRNFLKDDTLYLSKIFKWFKEDFKPDVVGFVQKHATGALKTHLQAAGEIKLSYLDYDWSLNGK